MKEIFEILGKDRDYSIRFIMTRKFESVDEWHAWEDEIAMEISFPFTRVSYTQKQSCYTISLYL